MEAIRRGLMLGAFNSAQVLPHVFANRILATFVIVATALAACGSPSATTREAATTPSPTAPEATTSLECEEQGYPCSPAEVPAEILTRSADLADQASEALATGESVAEVASALRAADGVADVIADDDALSFRLDGGVPTWVIAKGHPDADRAPDQTPDRAANVNALPVATFASVQTPGSTSTLDARVVGLSPEQKSAIVLSPFNWMQSTNDSSEEIAHVLSKTRGYKGRVTYLANAVETATSVTVETFLHLDGYSVVYLRSAGATICEPTEDGTDTYCRGMIAAQTLPGRDRSAFDSSQLVGLSLMRWNDGWDIGVTADFFAYYYPSGISHALIFFNVPDLLSLGLMTTVPGPYSSYIFWMGDRPHGVASPLALKVVKRLATAGITTHTLLQEMKSEFVFGESELVGMRSEELGSDRVREIAWLRDPATLKTLKNGASIAIEGEPDDGEPDVVPFTVDVDGLTDEEAEHTDLIVQVDDEEFSENQLASQAAERIDDLTWRFTGEVQLARDVKEGQRMKLRALLQLGDEGGASSHTVTGKVASDAFPLGTVWEGSFFVERELVWDGVTVMNEVTATFTRDPDDADDPTPTFTMTEGSFTWWVHGDIAGAGCTFEAPKVTTKLNVDEYSYINFDRSTKTISYSGFAELASGPSVDVQVVGCDNPLHNFDYRTSADGTFFLVARGEPRKAQGPTITGTYSYNDGATVYRWTIRRVR